ncbi:MAG: hypothetical protein JKY49_14575 [Cohaesibacteraceae bacterium]|nr:hypothetical protein [Cohaesibacteraceae bacterium]
MSDLANTITIADVPYVVTELPKPNSPLVVASRQKVLDTLIIDDMVPNLDRISHLLHLAYVGVREDADITNQVTQLQYDFMDLCTDMTLSMDTIQSSTGPLLKRLHWFSKLLYRGKEVKAFRFLEACNEHATQMATAAHKLSARFDKLADTAQATQINTTTAQGLEQDDKNALKKRMDKIKEQQASGNKRRDLLSDEIDDAKTRYAAALEEQHSQETAANKLALVKAFTGMVGQAVGGISSAYVMSRNPMAGMGGMGQQNYANNGGYPSDQNGMSQQGGGGYDAGYGSAMNDDMMQQDMADMGPVDQSMGTTLNNPDYLDGPGPGDDYDDMNGVDDGTTSDLNQPTVVQSAHIIRQQRYVAARGIGYNANMARSGNSTMPQSQKTQAQSLQEQTMKQLEIQMSLQKEQRELLGNLEAFASELTHKKDDTDYLTHAIAAMDAAIGALKKISSSFKNIGKNWQSFSDDLKNLGSADMEENIKMFTSADDPLEERLKDYHDPDTMTSIVTNYAAWQGLYLVIGQIAKKVDGARKVSSNLYDRNVSVSEAHTIALKLGTKLKESAEAELKILDSQIKENEILHKRVSEGAEA